MATILPFNNVVIGTLTVPVGEMVRGSGQITVTGEDQVVTTADGLMHYRRNAVEREAEFKCYGNYTALNSDAGNGVTCVMKLNTETVISFTGIVSAVYKQEDRITEVSIDGE